MKHLPHPPSGLIDPQLLMLAYRGGIFPMADSRDDPEIVWVEPRQRAIIPLDGIHVSRSLAKTLRQGRFSVTCNTAFSTVVDACAAPRPDLAGEDGESWISERIAASYCLLHRMGLAHSVECWRDGVLAGGLYGVGFDRVFCGESMFSRIADASKVALCWLVAAMRASHLELLDCQFITPHLGRMGARVMAQAQYLEQVRQACRPATPADNYTALPVGFSSVLERASSPGYDIAHSLTQTS
ncbi:leucyl/phenylalanyl-tRNA--protein transferase [Croceicoccus sp. F390]|uniref:Leucyl/phenylalanyl-tRNA--protein transferase n=2 Tax=Croceicoccus esteveae TaxID=3075597 RepID=A0ABU2ZML2_9SPHN|nr:leucyl/phenylalanyl-tRNA--protein transferase [Croceicoccus sp. F390]MDT0576824.1 leucyl/phenylalanyl-tRNA--protein transferase [Croceicoccus sp. F390]